MLNSSAISRLLGGDPNIRYYAAKCLSRIGPEAKGAVPVLIEALHDYDPQGRCYSAKDLGKIGAAAKVAMEP